jgi:TetR/AcrR family transcriptional regulator
MVSKLNRVSAVERRAQILGVAVQLFAQKGFKGTTTREIADRSRVNEAILFRHFPHKEDLYWAVVDSKCGLAKGRKDLQRILDKKSPRDALVKLAEEILRRNREDPTMTRIFFYTALENHELSQRLFRAYSLRYYDILADYIRGQIRRGAFRRVDPHLAARSFLGMVAEHYQSQELFGGKRYRKFDPRHVSETLADIWLGGLHAANGNHKGRTRGRKRP